MPNPLAVLGSQRPWLQPWCSPLITATFIWKSPHGLSNRRIR